MSGSLWLEMNERQSDPDLLREFARDGRQLAFATLARRHLDLVYATALRKVEDAGAAEEIAQNVFSALARKAWQFAPDDSLPAWLHKTALLESKSWLRGELRRRRREQTAAELGTTMRTPEDQPAFHALVPLLDEALLSLREKDRAALLLRYYESQSLRDVGAAFGVSEDTAQKRVQSALEKLAEFFKRRGFKTATVAAAAAALQHTAATASATLVSTVVGAALQAAPPALVGLGALLARLAGLSRVQTAVVCVALAAVPVGWQLNERHAAAGQLKRSQTQLLTAQSERSAAQEELERMQATFGKLQQTAAQQKEAADRAAESARAFDVWKQKTRSQLLAADYRWDDDSAFVRIPKALLPDLSDLVDNSPFSPPGVVKPYACELLCLTRAEHRTLEGTLQRVAVLQAGEKAEVYELDNPVSGGVLASRKFADRALRGMAGAEAEQHLAQLVTEMRGIIGDERWRVMPSRFRNVNVDLFNSALMPDPAATIEARVEVDTQGRPKASWLCTGEAPPEAPHPPAGVYSVNVVGYGNGSAPLSAFLPDADPDQRKQAADLGGIVTPEPIRRRVSEWFQEQAVLRLGRKEKP
ncbi:MAG: sigma-70 family RNA polymerase sigma factor [Verrucomicrobia bacterium]|nr:sigma-70 family RNA polymerase sigma factor [Verrucomicrobiota bacterium]